jgi:putative spermidine/putrescine transport system permease protein
MEHLLLMALRVLAGLALGFLVLPLLVIVPLSFTSGTLLTYPLPGLSLRWYAEFFTSPLWTVPLQNSLLIAVATTALATTLGTLAALGLARSTSRFKPVLMGLFAAPLVVPVIITAVALFYFYARLGLAGSYLALILAHTSLALPFVIVTVAATLQGFDQNLVRAASSLGASPLRTFFVVTLPLILPGICSGAVFAFITSFDDIVVALFVGSPDRRTLPRQIFSGVRESISPTITAAAVILILVSIATMVVVEALRRRAAHLRSVE